MNGYHFRVAGLAVLTLCLAGSPVVVAQVDNEAGSQRRKLIEQKLRLVELLAQSSVVKAAGSSGAAATVEKRRELLEQARHALAVGQLEQAGQILDEALVRAGNASQQSSASSAELSEVARRAKLKNLSEQLASYRGTLQSLAAEDGSGGEARLLLARTDGMAKEAESLAASGRLEEASQRLAEAYRLLVAGLAQLQAGRTVVLSLKFDTPDQEYIYEQRRFQSNEMLLRMNVEDSPSQGQQRLLVDRLAADGHRLRDEAAGLATSGDYKAAVRAMEKASAQLIRALQSMGVPVF